MFDILERYFAQVILNLSISCKFHPRTSHGVPEGEEGYSSTPSLTSALVYCGWSTPRPGCFTPGKHITHCAGSRVGRVRKISPPSGFYPWTFQPIASRYTEYTIPVLLSIISFFVPWGEGREVMSS